MEDIGARLRQERLRLGVEQRDLAARVGISRNTLGLYESGKSPPKLEALFTFEKHGIDIGFVLTGRRAAPEPGDIDQRFLNLFRSLDPRRREALMDFLLTFCAAPVEPDDLVRARRTLHEDRPSYRSPGGTDG